MTMMITSHHHHLRFGLYLGDNGMNGYWQEPIQVVPMISDYDDDNFRRHNQMQPFVHST